MVYCPKIDTLVQLVQKYVNRKGENEWRLMGKEPDWRPYPHTLTIPSRRKDSVA